MKILFVTLLLFFCFVSIGQTEITLQRPELELDDYRIHNGELYILWWHEYNLIKGKWHLKRFYIKYDEMHLPEPTTFEYECKIEEIIKTEKI